MNERTCSVSECGKPPRNRTAELCGMHYHRVYRHGRLDASAPESGISVSHGRRYLSTYVPDHPLAAKNGKAYVHRVVLYDSIGPGPHPCHWCAKPVDWVAKGQPDCLHVDHLNNIGDDNDPANLVPSCMPCNGARGSARRRQALLDAGWWSEHDTIARLRDPSRQRKTAA